MAASRCHRAGGYAVRGRLAPPEDVPVVLARLLRVEEWTITMDWSDSAEQAQFRTAVHEVIETKLPERYRVSGGDSEGGSWQTDRIASDPQARQAAQDWAHALSERGWSRRTGRWSTAARA